MPKSLGEKAESFYKLKFHILLRAKVWDSASSEMWLKWQRSSYPVFQSIALLTGVTMTQNCHEDKKKPWQNLELDSSLRASHLGSHRLLWTTGFGPGPANEEYWIPGLPGYSQLLTVTLQNMSGMSESGEQIRTGADGMTCRVREEHCQVLGVAHWVCVLRSPN